MVFPTDNQRTQFCEKCVVCNKCSQKIGPVDHKLLGRAFLFLGEIHQNREKCYEEETNIFKQICQTLTCLGPVSTISSRK